MMLTLVLPSAKVKRCLMFVIETLRRRRTMDRSHHQNPSSSFSSHQSYQSNVQPDTYDSRYYRTFPNPGRASQSSSSNKNFQSSSNSIPSQSNKPSRTKDIQCYHCGKWGHFARNCYQRNNPSSSPSVSRQQKNQ
ncbi:unnamed protein product [Rotaria sordida]|uniref:CCHC-type domain-containing protein n=1 Tax=Rotaria sordida TaxID=392033 RepID=A0A820JBQ0_9BILA|nr:unnamed protein product [Rotaria sordida]